ncbi:MAG: hypothetical protein LBJ57_06385 [Prevotellaceae bacterium]|nr:hypothetical protein [Prevotellaceae bacterium]
MGSKHEIRCPRCGRLHGVAIGGNNYRIEIRCSRCKAAFVATATGCGDTAPPPVRASI